MRRVTVLITVLALALVGLVAPAPAVAQVAENLACPPSIITPAGFTDVDPASVHKADIDCLAWYGITSGTTPTTFNPKGLVTRWQMALFLSRTASWINMGDRVDGRSMGFTDIGGLSGEAQLAVNKLSQLSITTGTTPTTYSPSGTVTRWQMALFLTRLMRADGVVLPDGANQGFADIGNLPAETQKAINQLKQLGITTGTSPTTFAPNGTVTREQMASFLARALMADGTIVFLSWGTGNCDEQGNCTGSATYPANTDFVHRPYWYLAPLPVPPEEQGFFTTSTRVELTWNGQAVALTEYLVPLQDIVYKYYQASFPGGLTGSHTFQTMFFDENLLTSTSTITVLFTE